MSKKKSHYSKAGLVFEELEPRLLLSADPIAVATDAGGATVQELVLDNNEDQAAVVQSNIEHAVSTVRNELVIIDSRAPNYQQLHNDLIRAQQEGRNIHVVVLDAHRDGIEQINEALSRHNKFDAVHIVSHGDDGQLQLGATQLNKTTLRDRSADISSWKDTFTEGGDLLIYGCNLAESEDGKSLVHALGYLTATDVAASDDLTGNKLLGGDWDLEYNFGDVETQVAFSENIQQQWDGTLADVVLEANESVPTDSGEIKSDQSYAQEFSHDSAGSTYEVNEIEIMMYRDSDPAADNQAITVSIRDGWNSATILGSATISSNDLDTTARWENFDIGSVFLDDTTSYVIQIDSDTTTGKVFIGVDPAASYTNGDLLKNGSPEGKDAVFRVNQNTPPVAQDDSYTVYEDTSLISVASVLDNDTDAENDTLTVNTTPVTDVSNGSLTLNADGSFTYTPDAGFIGTDSFVYEVDDGSNNTAQATVTIDVINSFAVVNTSDSGTGSLRQAILNANAAANSGVPDEIFFDIAGSGPHVINLASALPAITEAVFINGGSEPDFSLGGDGSARPVVVIDGSGAGTVNGLVIGPTASGSTIHGLVIQNFWNDGILIQSDNNTITGNILGLDYTGTAKRPNNQAGTGIHGNIRIESASFNVIGGTNAADRNIISGSGFTGVAIAAGSTFNQVLGNYIGTDITGTAGLGNNQEGIEIDNSSNNTIGGTVSGARNIISANGSDGMEIDNGDNNIIQGNYIGTDVTGTVALGNVRDGIDLNETAGDGSTGNLIGGTDPNAGNLIAHNLISGVEVRNAPTTDNTIIGNRIYDNGSIGIALNTDGVTANDAGDADTGFNDYQNYPVLTSAETNAVDAIRIDGTLNTTANSYFRVEFFSSNAGDVSGFGEGETYLGYANVSTDGGGNAAISTILSAFVADGAVISATATQADVTYTNFDSTSEFSANISAALNTSAIATDDSYIVAEDQTLVIDALTENATAADLVASWQLDEGTGATTVDDTGNGNDGTLNGASWTTSSRTGDAALSFDGVNDYVNMGSDASIDNIFAGGGTISAWINPTGWGENNYGRMLDKSATTTAGNGWSLQLNANRDTIRFEHGFDGVDYGGWEAPISSITLGSWQHVIVVYDNSSAANDPLIYINGVLQTVIERNTPLGSAESDVAEDLFIGNFPGATSRTFDGSIDEVGIYDRVLTPAEIAALFQTGIIANDMDIDGDALSSILVSGPSNGMLALNTDGSFTYTPNANFNGIDSFTYKVNDGVSDSNIATVNITVTSVNDAPVLDAAGTPTLAQINEGDTNNNGDTVADIIASAGGDPITDADSGALEGIAITWVDDTNGSWEYSIDGGSNWTVIGTVSDASALLLTDNSSNRIRFVPATNYNGTAQFDYRAWDRADANANATAGVDVSVNGGSTAYSTARETVSITIQPVKIVLYMATSGDVSSSGAPGLDGWNKGELLGFGDPGVDLEPGTTDGTLYKFLDLRDFDTGVISPVIDAVHQVSKDVTVGGNGGPSINLFVGDILFSVDSNNVQLTGSDAVEITTDKQSLYLFRPDVPGNYTAGTFSLVLDGFAANEVEGISLVEADTIVGDTLLTAGSFIYNPGNSVDIWLYTVNGVGAGTTTGTSEILIDGSDISMGTASAKISGVDLIEDSVNVGGTSLVAGNILVTIDGTDTDIGNNNLAVTSNDVFLLDVTTTTKGATSTSSADAYMLIEGADINLDTSDEEITALSLEVKFGSANQDPVISLPGGSISYTENDPAVIIESGATVNDPDSFDFSGGILRVASSGGTVDDRLAVRNEGSGPGQVGITGNTVSYAGITIGTFNGGIGTTPLVIVFNSNATSAVVQAVMRNVTYENVSDEPDTTQRTVRFVVTDGDGGTSNVQSKTINITAINDHPALATNTGMTVAEGSIGNVITTVMLNEGDPDDSGNGLVYTVTNVPSYGSLYFSGITLGNNDNFTQADLDAGLITYDHDGSQNLADSFTFSLADGGEDGATVLTGQVFNFTVTNVNDAPVIGGDDIGSVTEDVDPDADNLLETSGALTIADEDPGESVFIAETVDGEYGSLSIDLAGNWNYTADNTQAAVNRLDAGDTLTDTLTVTTADGTTHDIVITINGANDGPLAQDDTYSVDEDGVLTSTDSWVLSGWNTRQTLSFNNLAQTEILTDFPVLITLDSSRIDYSKTQDQGQDLRFVDTDGTVLAHEIERWDENGTSYVWVKVPQIDAASGNDYISMYYGNAGVADGQNVPGVWTDGFHGVYHLGETGSALGDSSASNYDGTVYNGTTSVDGVVGAARDFERSTADSIDLGYDRDFLNATNVATMSAWIKPETLSGTGAIVGVSVAGASPQSASRFSITTYGNNVQVIARSTDSTSSDVVVWTNTSPLSTNTWHYVTAVVDYQNDTVDIYVDGVLQTITGSTSFASSPTPNTPSSAATIGSNESKTNELYDGVIDEVRIANVARTEQWIKAAYQSQKDHFVSYGYEQTVAGVLGNDIDPEGHALTASLVSGTSNGTLVFNADGTFTYTPDADFNGSDSFVYEVDDGSGNTSQATVDISVNPVNDVPITTPVTLVAIAEDSGGRLITQAELLANANDVDGDALTATNLAISAGAGTLVDNGNGTWTYSPALNDDSSVSFSYTVTDGALTGAGTAILDITPVNDAPVVDLDADDSSGSSGVDYQTTFIELNGAVSIIDTDVSLLDVDSANLTSITVTLTNELENGNKETLAANAGSTGLTVNWNSSTDVLTISGAGSVADYLSVLTTVTYNNTANNPDTTPRIITFDANDGVADSLLATTTVNVSQTFKPPVNTVPGPQTVAEDAALSISGISVRDNDNNLTSVALSVNNGTLNVNLQGGVTISTGANGSNTLTLSGGTETDINNTLATLVYQGALNFNGTDTLTVLSTDAFVNIDTDTVALTVTPVNDVPTTTLVTLAAVAEESGPRLITQAELLSNANDVDGDALTAINLVISAGAGSLIDNGDGTWSYTPALNDDTNVSFSYTVTDGILSTAGSATLDITPVNDAPTTTPVTLAAIAEDSGARLITQAELLANANDIDGDPLTATNLVISSGAGTLVDNGNGTWTYTPALNDDTSVSFSYTVTDGVLTAAGSATLDITPVNDSPTTTPVTLAAIAEDSGPRLITDAELLANANDVDGDVLTVSNLAASAGTLVDNGNGTWTYTSVLNDDAGISFSYDISDGVVTIAGSATMDITPVNDAPVAVNDSYTTSEDAPLTTVLGVSDLLLNDSDVEGNSLTVNTTPVVNVSNGMLLLNADGTFTYTPNSNFNGSDSFTYEVSDGNGGTAQATVTITVTAMNDAPVAINDSYTTNEDTALTAVLGVNDLLLNDSDIDGDTLTVNTTPVVNVNNGTLILNANGTFTYTPNSNFNGSDSFTYEVSDGNGGTAQAAVTITVTAMNDAPTTAPVTLAAIAEDSGPRLISEAELLANANDVDGDVLTVSNLAASAGTLVDNGNGTWTYTPVSNDDTGVSFSYNISDGIVTIAGSASMDITPVNDPAVIAGVDSGVVTEDLDPDLDNMLEVGGVMTIVDPDAGEAIFNSGVIGGSYGVITLNAAGTWLYEANTNQAAIQALTTGQTLIDTITVSSVDGTTHDITITIMGANDAPVAGNDVANVNEGGSVIIDIATSDSDVDNALDLNSIAITGLPANGSVVINGDGTVTYAHNGSETLADSFSYTISDISGAVSNTATVSLSVNPVNDPPIAGDDAAIVAEGNTILIDLAANDVDVDNALDLNSISIIGAPVNGALIVNGDGTVTYNHDGSETTSDSFSYTIADISGAISNTATVNIAVTPVNDAPTTSGIAAATVNEDAANTSIDLNAAFGDADNLDSELTYSIIGNTNIGLFSAIGINNSTAQLMLDYATDMNGSTQITIRAADPAGLSVDTLFSVSVTPVNDAPMLQANAGIQAATGIAATITSSELNASDIDNTPTEIIYTVTSVPANGVLMLNGTVMAVSNSFTQDDLDNNRLVYLPAGTSPADQFSFIVSDSAGSAMSSNTFNIVVQLAQADNSGDIGTPPNEGSAGEETKPETLSGTGSGGVADQGGGYGGGYVPFGSSSVPKEKPELSIDRKPMKEPDQPRTRQAVQMNDLIIPEPEEFKLETFTDIQVKSMDALWASLDEMKQEITESAEEKISEVEFKVAAAKSSGVVLTAGVVAWVLRSGALLSSLISTIPLWKGYDPLPILAYKDDEEKEEDEIHEDKIPTSLEELKKLKKLKQKMVKENDVDSIFGGSIIRE